MKKLANCCHRGQNLYKIKGNKTFTSKGTSFFSDVFIVNGFTLIELIGVIILLGVIGIITYPIVNKSIQNSREKALEKTIENIEHAAYLYSIDNNIGYSEAYNNLDIQSLKDLGFLEDRDIINPVTEEKMSGCIIYKWIDEYNQYEFKYTEPCAQAPTIALKNKDGVFNEKGWAISPFYVSINSNTESYQYCVSDKECTPDTLVNSGNGEVYINVNMNNYVCVQATNDLGSSEVVCEQYKLDTKAPVLASTTVYFDKGDNRLYDLLNITSASGYKVDCDKQHASELEIGSNTVSCTVLGNNGLSTTKIITFKPNRLKTAGYNDTTFLGSSILKEKVESIKTLDHTNVSTNAIEVVDISEKQNRSILAWYTDVDSNDLYELYIGQNGGVIANYDSANLFKIFTNVVTMDIKSLDTTQVVHMTGMFYNMSSLTELDVSNFNTSKVLRMGNMFFSVQNVKNLDVSNFDTSKVTNMSGMFWGMDSLLELDLSNFNTSNVTDMGYMFNGLSSITKLDVSNFDTSKVISMTRMFAFIPQVSKLDLSNFNTSQVINMSQMFWKMEALIDLDISSFDTSNVTNMSGMFQEVKSLEVLDISHFNTSQVTNMGGMFAGMSSLTELDVSNFDTSQATNMSYMFQGMENLLKLDVSNFDTSKVTNMSGMFYEMDNLTELDISSFDTSKVTNMAYMFFYTESLETLDLSHFDTSNVTNMYAMFMGCSSLTSLDISNFNTSQVTTMVYTFRGMGITSLDLSHFDTSNVTDMTGMFHWGNFEYLNISSFDISKVTKYDGMFLYGKSNFTVVVNEDIKDWIQTRITEANKTANIEIAS